MKKLKHITIWIFISVVIQLSTLFYLDKYYLKTETSFQIKKVVQQAPKRQKVEISVPSDATQIGLSFDGKYLSYSQNNTISVVTIDNGQVKTISADNGNKVSMYKWLSDRDRMFIAEKPQSGSGSIVLNYFDASKSVKNKIENITSADTKSEVQDIEVAPMTNVTYVKVKRNGTKSDIYSSNAMNDIKKIETVTSNIGNIKVIAHKDELIYEDSVRKRVYSTNISLPISIKGVNNLVLLGVDSSDNVYLGSVNNDKIDKVFYGSTKNPTDQWQAINISTPCDIEDIFISGSGDILINDNLKGQVLSLKTNKITTYTGTFELMRDVGIISVDNGKLVKTIYK